jgi:hypothetical protein
MSLLKGRRRLYTDYINTRQRKIGKGDSLFSSPGFLFLEVVMKVVIDRDLCDNSLPFCQRCSAAFIRYPEGTDRLCIRDIIDDGSEKLTIEMKTDGRLLEISLTDEERELASVEGWEALADFDPALFRSGAAERWRELRQLPVNN